jgi:hypothetical protein
MAASDLSAALLATDSLFASADAVLNGGRTDARLTVKASFRSGSFGIDFNSAVSLAERFKDIFASDAASSIVNAQTILGLLFGATGLFKLLKWLGRKRPTKIELEEGRVLIFKGDEYFKTEQRVLALYRNFKVRQALEDVVTSPLRKEGITDFAVVARRTVIANANREEADYFIVDVAEEERLDEATRETWLNVVSATFKEGDKWRFNDGSTNFYASVSDPDFLKLVAANQLEFGAATRLRVRLHEIQSTDAKGQLHKEIDIQRVLDIKKPDEQLRLFIAEAHALPRLENKGPDDPKKLPE